MPKPTRQLAAIMFTDIVGYTAMMGKDSNKTLELVRQSKQIQKPLVEKHNGNWLKEMGDGAMVQFGSALDAVNCALEIQRTSRADFEADLRIGIHLGDITIENNDVYGDGVNVAARLESIADPGGIYISESIEKAIRGQSKVQAKYLGEVNLKNVDYGVRTYALQGVGLPVPNLKKDKELSGRIFAEIKRRGVIRAAIMYILISLLLVLLQPFASTWITFPGSFITMLLSFLGIGFPIALYLAWRFERSPEGFVRTTSNESWQNPLVASKRKPFTGNLIMVGLGLVIVFLLVYPKNIIDPLPVDSINEISDDDKSIAVLPFDNLSADEDNQYFADGQMEAILNHLSKIADLRVISRTTMMGYRGTTKSVPEIAKELGVRYVLEGSVQKYGQKVRITAQLIDPKSDGHLWSDNFDRDLADIFGIQTEIAKQVVEELKATITSREQAIIESVPTANLIAYDFYLKGLDFASRSYKEEDYRYGLQMFANAVDIDPDFTLAWVGLAGVSRGLYWLYFDRSPARLEQTKAYLDKAIALDPDLVEVQIATGIYYYQCQLNYPLALEILEGLISVYPKNDRLQIWTGAVYRRMGQFEKALEFMDRAIKLNPSEWGYWEDGGQTLIMLKRYKQAEIYFKTTIDLNPYVGGNNLILVYLTTGELEKARAYANNHYKDNPGMYNSRTTIELMSRNYDKAISIMDSSSEVINSSHVYYTPKSMQLGLIYYMMPDKKLSISHFQEARKMLEDKLNELPDDSRIYSSLGIVYAGLGMRKEALEAGSKALSIMNISVDAMRGFVREQDMARILLLVGEYDQCISKLEFLLQQNGNMTIELLKLHPFWDSLRELDSFKALINNPKYQVNLN